MKDCSLGAVTVSCFKAERFIFSGHRIPVKNRLHNAFHITLDLPLIKLIWEKNAVFSPPTSTTSLKCLLRKLPFTCYELRHTEIVFIPNKWEKKKKKHNIGENGWTLLFFSFFLFYFILFFFFCWTLLRLFWISYSTWKERNEIISSQVNFGDDDFRSTNWVGMGQIREIRCL